MLRLAQPQDVSQLTTGLLDLKAKTGWALYGRSGYDRASLTDFLHRQLQSPDSVLYVWGSGHLYSFCGGSLDRFNLPPYMPIVCEWGWFGGGRSVVHCWDAVKSWGKRRGAELARRVLARPGSSKTRIREEVTWEVL